jgi:hypothetical protein
MKHVIEGCVEERIKVAEKRLRRSKQLLYDLKEKREWREYLKWKEESLDHTL